MGVSAQGLEESCKCMDSRCESNVSYDVQANFMCLGERACV